MGSSGGGGSSGEVSWPQWISDLHKKGAEALWTEVLIAHGNNPYLGYIAWNPDPTLSWMYEASRYFGEMVTHYHPYVDWSDAIDVVKLKLSEVYTDERIDEAVLAYSDLLNDNLEQHTLPRFRAGMRDINAVQSTAFVIGESVLEANKNREVAKYAADLRKNFESKEIDHLMQNAMALAALQGDKVKMVEAYSKLELDHLRMAAILKKEEHADNTEYRVESATWNMNNLTQYGNYIANMHGGVSGNNRKPSKTASAIGGAASGASMGYMVGAGTSIGGPWGAAIGAAVGVGASLLSN